MAGGARSRESHRRRAVEKRQARRCWRDRRSPGKSAHLVRELVGVTLVDGLGGEEEGASVLGGHLRGSRRGNASEGVERESARFRSAEKAASGKARSIAKRRRSTRRLARRRRRATATDARSRASRGRRTLCDEAKGGVWKVEVVRESGARGRRRALFTAIGVGADGANGGLSAPCWPHNADVRMKETPGFGSAVSVTDHGPSVRSSQKKHDFRKHRLKELGRYPSTFEGTKFRSSP